MKLIYFAWVRERIGKGEEDVELPADVTRVSDLLAWLKGRGENYGAALEYPEIIRVAINQEHVSHDTPLPESGEIALFPPMTGG
ncbi:molybdopterin converting factor subunit 1 [Nitratireductor luteus]|uniref:molybdopterin converting factor subunit 1 n=1 Tax=Nitratireductor luteus TaxID=2976980 RepID=UPI00223FAAF3|nr:molybdopterin converting factor subunit 1 [Nitratireductor luteus]